MDGAPGEIRTPDRSVRSRVLYPAELQALNLETRFYGLLTGFASVNFSWSGDIGGVGVDIVAFVVRFPLARE